VAPARFGAESGRPILFHLNRKYGLNLPTDPHIRGAPQAMDYDPHEFTIALEEPDNRFFESIRAADLPRNGMRVFRVTGGQTAQVPDTTVLHFTHIYFAVSTERFTDKTALIEHLETHREISRAANLTREADYHKRRGDLAQAERLYRKSLAIFGLSRAARELGFILMKQGKTVEAEPLLAFAARTRGNRWDYWDWLGRAYEALEKPTEAVHAYETAIEQPNVGPWVLSRLAKLHKSQGDYENAHFAYTRMAQNLNEPGYLLEAVKVRLAANQPELALEESLAVVAGHPDHGWAHLVVTQCYERLGRRDEAYQHLVKAAALRPDDLKTQARCAQYHIEFGKYNEAESLLVSVLERHTDDASLAALLEQVRNAAAGDSGS